MASYMSLRAVVLSAVVVASAGCMGAFDKRVALVPGAVRVELVSAAVIGCEPLGDVFGQASAEGDMEQAVREARNDVRNKAFAIGATHVVLQNSAAAGRMGVWVPR